MATNYTERILTSGRIQNIMYILNSPWCKNPLCVVCFNLRLNQNALWEESLSILLISCDIKCGTHEEKLALIAIPTRDPEDLYEPLVTRLIRQVDHRTQQLHWYLLIDLITVCWLAAHGGPLGPSLSISNVL